MRMRNSLQPCLSAWRRQYQRQRSHWKGTRGCWAAHHMLCLACFHRVQRWFSPRTDSQHMHQNFTGIILWWFAERRASVWREERLALRDEAIELIYKDEAAGIGEEKQSKWANVERNSKPLHSARKHCHSRVASLFFLSLPRRRS